MIAETTRDIFPRPHARSLMTQRELLLLVVMILLILGVELVRPSFLSIENVKFILLDCVVLALVALGESFVLLGRGIDLSVAPIMGLGAIVTGIAANVYGISVPQAVLLAIVLGAALGAINGAVVTLMKVPPIIATLGTLSIYSGCMFIFLNGEQVNKMPAAFKAFGNDDVLPSIPLPVLLLLAVTVTCWAVLRHTVFGRNIYAVGGNADAARNAGVPVRLTVFLTFVAAGVLSAFAGLMWVSYSGYAMATTGTGTHIELQALAAALIGGVSIAGGRGNVIGAVIGSVFLAVILAAVVSLQVPAMWQAAAEGLLILLAISIDTRAANRAKAADAARL